MSSSTKPKTADLLLSGSARTWTSPEITEMNRLEARSTFERHASPEAAMKAGSSASARCLDGEWDFRMLDRPEEVSPELVRSRSGRGWARIPVPSNWTLHGYGHPHYTNQGMPFDGDPPEVPGENPTGVYRKGVRIPASWRNKRVHLEVGGAESVLYVYVNGKAIGMGKDTRLPSEFDLTPHIAFGEENLLTLVVVKWSDASYIEDQDQWWMGGIFRSVILRAVAPVHFADIGLIPELNPERTNGILRGRARIRSHLGWDQSVRLSAKLLGPKGRIVAVADAEMPARHWNLAPLFREIDFAFEVKRPRLWNAEEPQGYTAVLELTCGRIREATTLRTAFRDVSVEDGQLRVNGRPIRIHGVNRHEHDPDTGKFVSRERMWREARLMKALNINAVRTSHYPSDPYWYEVCDTVGLYVIDEANIEAHAYHNILCRDPRYAPAFLERVKRMVLRDRNHPSVILWSLGNESGYGPNHDAAAGWVRHADPSRPLHYEGAISKGQSQLSWHDGHRVTDIICPMYSSIEELTAWMLDPHRDHRPVIPCEYSHAMGNSNGSLSDYDALFERFHEQGLQGGFIWEWIDHGLRATAEDGTRFLAYGGDFGDTPHDANFVCDGLVGPDLDPHPACEELKFLARPVKIESVDWKTGWIALRNCRDFLDTNDIRAGWRLKREGRVLAKGSLAALPIAPGDTKSFRLKGLKGALPEEGPETFLELSFRNRKASEALPAGHEYACEQVEVPLDTAHVPPIFLKGTEDTPPERDEQEHMLVVRASGRHWEWNRETGLLHRFSTRSGDVIAGPVQPLLWRAAIDNDGLKLWTGQENKALGRWRRLGLDRMRFRCTKFRMVTASNGILQVRTVLQASGRGNFDDFRIALDYAVSGCGDWTASYRVDPGPEIADLPRVGLEFPLDPRFDSLEFMGRGPWENYSDRREAARLDVHRKELSECLPPYIMPQEYGHHTGTRWIRLRDGRAGPRISADRVFEFNYTPYATGTLYSAFHREELPEPEQPWLVLDIAHRGVGTGSCGPDTREPYRLTARSFSARFLFS